MDGIRSIERIADVLRPLDADVICLQEVNRRLPWSRFEDQPGKLSTLLGMKALFQSNYRVGLGGFGNLILTRLPVKERLDVKLPNPRERASILRRMEGRGAVGAILTTDGRPILVLCTHWSLDATDRAEAVPALREVLASRPGPAVLAGDLNACDDSPEISRLVSELQMADSGACERLPTFTSTEPSSRIDYVLISTHLGSAHPPRVINSIASDHLPVVVDLTLQP
jgi:endonuclease/exonuclease/phosphatase family metal-dependent hydrolase